MLVPLRSGETFAGYRILRPLGSGGMGEVYLAQHPRLPRRDALKILPGNVSANAEFRLRFGREADLASTLFHPNIVGVHDRGEFDGQLWITMDYVDGLDAAKLLACSYPTGMPVAMVVKIVTAVASALDYAHEQDLLHRDVKPANIMLTHWADEAKQRILLADFGIARNINDIHDLTGTNMTVGTVGYAAPRQLMGKAIDGRADQYALAATAYHLLTGRRLFPDSNPVVVVNKQLNANPPALADIKPRLSRLDSALAVALAKEPKDRFVCCTDFARAMAEQSSPCSSAGAFAPTKPAVTDKSVRRQCAPPSKAANTPPKSVASQPPGATDSLKRPFLAWLLFGAMFALVITIVTAITLASWLTANPDSTATRKNPTASTTQPAVSTSTSLPADVDPPAVPSPEPTPADPTTSAPPTTYPPMLGRRAIDSSDGFSYGVPVGWVDSDTSHLEYGSVLLSKQIGGQITPGQTIPVANDTRIVLGKLDEQLFASAEADNAKAATRLGSDMGEFFMPYPGMRVGQELVPLNGYDGLTGSASYYEVKFNDAAKPVGQIWSGVIGLPAVNSARNDQRWFVIWLATSENPLNRSVAKAVTESIRPWP